jgi:hypothetical protein
MVAEPAVETLAVRDLASGNLMMIEVKIMCAPAGIKRPRLDDANVQTGLSVSHDLAVALPRLVLLVPRLHPGVVRTEVSRFPAGGLQSIPIPRNEGESVRANPIVHIADRVDAHQHLLARGAHLVQLFRHAPAVGSNLVFTIIVKTIVQILVIAGALAVRALKRLQPRRGAARDNGTTGNGIVGHDFLLP